MFKKKGHHDDPELDEPTEVGIKHSEPPPRSSSWVPPLAPSAPSAPVANEGEPFNAEGQYAAYYERKKLNTAVPPPTWVQLDDLEKASWEAATAAAIAAIPPPVTEPEP